MTERSEGPSHLRALYTWVVVGALAFELELVFAHHAGHVTSLQKVNDGLHQAGVAMLSLALGMYLHEFAHAAAVRICGQSVRRVQLGVGQVLFAVGRVEFRAIPIHGFTTRFGHGSRWQVAFIAAAGPLANLALAGLVFTGLSSLCGPFVAAIGVPQLGLGIGNLVPRTSRYVPRGNDGKQIIDQFRRPPTTLVSTGPSADARRTRLVAEALIEQGRADEAVRLLTPLIAPEQPEVERGIAERLMRRAEAAAREP
jgi:membrane-associated protease RseP (regulator of RpoE activity)